MSRSRNWMGESQERNKQLSGQQVWTALELFWFMVRRHWPCGGRRQVKGTDSRIYHPYLFTRNSYFQYHQVCTTFKLSFIDNLTPAGMSSELLSILSFLPCNSFISKLVSLLACSPGHSISHHERDKYFGTGTQWGFPRSIYQELWSVWNFTVLAV